MGSSIPVNKASFRSETSQTNETLLSTTNHNHFNASKKVHSGSVTPQTRTLNQSSFLKAINDLDTAISSFMEKLGTGRKIIGYALAGIAATIALPGSLIGGKSVQALGDALKAYEEIKSRQDKIVDDLSRLICEQKEGDFANTAAQRRKAQTFEFNLVEGSNLQERVDEAGKLYQHIIGQVKVGLKEYGSLDKPHQEQFKKSVSDTVREILQPRLDTVFKLENVEKNMKASLVGTFIAFPRYLAIKAFGS